MVFEQIYSTSWIERKPEYAFLLGLFYSVLGIATALFLFPEDPSLASIAFTTLALIPTLNKLLGNAEETEAREKTLSLRLLFRDHKDIFKIYIFLFLGILLSFSIFSIILPNQFTGYIFEKQLSVYPGFKPSTGHAADFTIGNIFSNNIKVMLVCLGFSLIYGSGAIFLITWNASVWGAIFGYITKESAVNQNPFIYFVLLLFFVMPHMLTEALGYFSAAIAGGVISKATIREKFFSDRFNQIMMDGMIIFLFAIFFVIFGAFLEVKIFPLISWIGNIGSPEGMMRQGYPVPVFTFIISSILILITYKLWRAREKQKKVALHNLHKGNFNTAQDMEKLMRLHNFVKKQEQRGISKDKIISALSQKGWSQSIIERAFQQKD